MALVVIGCAGISGIIGSPGSDPVLVVVTATASRSSSERLTATPEADFQATGEAQARATVIAQSALTTLTTCPIPMAEARLTQTGTDPAEPTTTTQDKNAHCFRIEQRARSDQKALQQVTLALRSAELTADKLILRIALENTTNREFLITGSFSNSNALLLDAAGNRYEPLQISENLQNVSPAGGFAPGSANVGNLTFARPTSGEPYELRLLSYEPIQFLLAVPWSNQEGLVEVLTGAYPLEMTLRSDQEALAPIELQVYAVQVAADQLTFEVGFVNTLREGYDLLVGPAGGDAWLLDAEGSQYRPVAVSASLEDAIDPEQGWQPGQVHTGTLTFPRPQIMPEVRFLFPQYSALTLHFDEAGLVEAQVTSATGGKPLPTPTPGPEAQIFAALNHLLADQAKALLTGDTDVYLSTFVPELRPQQQIILDRTAQMPLETYTVEVAPAAQLASGETGLIEDVEVEIRYTLRNVPNTNPFLHVVRYDFKQEGNRWQVSEVEAIENPPFWWTGEVLFRQTDHFLIFTRSETADELPTLAHEVETAYTALTRRGLPLESRYVAYFTATGEGFQRLTGQQTRALGVTTSRYELTGEVIGVFSQAFYINGEAFVKQQDQLSPAARQSTITHELVHLALAPHTRPFMPPWLTEGVAVYFAGQNTPETRRRLIEEGKLDTLSLETLTRTSSLGRHDFTGAQIEDAYIFSGEVINYLVETFGEELVLAFYRSYVAVPATQVRDKIPYSIFGSTAMDTAFADLSQELTVEATQQFFNRSLAELDAEVKAWLLAKQP